MNLVNSPQEVRNNFVKLNACVLIPTYNNEKTLEKVIRDVLLFTDRIIVVNDGSTDSTEKILAQFEKIEIITFEKNKGKGCALKAGFKTALDKKFEYAITIDSDGQHFPADLPKFLTKIEEQPGSLIIGARNMDQEGIPRGSSFGHKFSNFWFWFEAGIRLPDTQCGFRLYPLKKIQELKFFTTRFEFEIEVIVKAAWRGVHVTSVPVKVIYQKGEDRVSHFRKKTDFTRVSLINTWLVILSIFYFHPRRFLHKLNKNNIRSFLKKNIYDKNESSAKRSLAVALGVMMGIMPVWGYQLILALALAFLFKLNKVIVALATNISLPPIIPFILYGSIKTGELVSGKKSDILFSGGITLDLVKKNLLIYLAGSMILAIISSVIAGLLTYSIITLSGKKTVRA